MEKKGFVLSNGFRIKPVVLDCCLGVDGYGPPGLFGNTINDLIDRKNSTTICKSITRHPKVGNFGSSILSKSGWAMTEYGFPLPKKLCYLPIGADSTVNSYGLTNDGIDDFVNMDFANNYVIPSIFLEFGKGEKEDIARVKQDAQYMGEKLREKFKKRRDVKLVAVVLNISCPNSGHGVCLISNEIVEVVKIFKEAIGNIPVGIKYSYLQDISLAKMLHENVEIEFHQAINTIPFKLIFGDDKFSPLSHIGHGGVSGPAIKDKALNYAMKLRSALGPDAKIIGGGGISNLISAQERALCCDSIAIGILVNRNTIEANKIIAHFAN